MPVKLEICKDLTGKIQYVQSFTKETTYDRRTAKHIPRRYRVDTQHMRCSCPSFQHQHGVDGDGLCKHIRDLIQHSCQWTELSPIRQTVPLRCPICGNKTIGVEW